MPRRLLLALALCPIGACFVVVGLSAPAGATAPDAPTGASSSQFSPSAPGDDRPAASLVLQAVACRSWAAIPANFTPDAPLDDTFGRYRLWGPTDVNLVRPVPAAAIGDGCRFIDGVSFRLSGTPYGNGLVLTQRDDLPNPYPPEATTVLPGATGQDGAGTLRVGGDQLTEPQRRSLVDGVGLWVAATELSAEFANLRCHDDRYNADNLEVLRAAASDRQVACVLYMIDTGPVPAAAPGTEAPTGSETGTGTVSTPSPRPPAATPVADPTTPDVVAPPPAPVIEDPNPSFPDAAPVVVGPPPAVGQGTTESPVPAAVAPVAPAPAPAPAAEPPNGTGLDASADRAANTGSAESTAAPAPVAPPLLDPLAAALRSELTVSLEVRKVGLGPVAPGWVSDGVVVLYSCGDEQPKRLKLKSFGGPVPSAPLALIGGAVCELTVAGPPAAGDEPAPIIVVDGRSATIGNAVAISITPGARRNVAVVVDLPGLGVGTTEIAADGPTTDTSLVAAGPVATGGSQLTTTAAVGLSVVFLAGLGLSVVSARRPL